MTRITRALVRRPARNVADGLTTQPHLGPPDFDRTIYQYGLYLDALRSLGLNVTVLPADERYPDGHFVEDTAVIYHNTAFICRMREASREGEIVEIMQNLTHLRREFVRGEKAYIDGGDVLFTTSRVLIGLSRRTNLEGARQLSTILRKINPALKVDTVPFEGLLHLKSGLSELAPGVLVRSPLLQTDYDFSFADVTVLPPEESYAANLVPINDTLLMARGDYPTLLELARQHYDKVIQLDMTEFQKMDGGLSCLSLRY